MKIIKLLSVSCLLSFASFPTIAFAQNDHAASIAQLKTYRFGGDQAVLNTVAQWVNAARSDAGLRRIAARELAEVLTSNASFDAKQFACRELVLVAGEEQVQALAALLRDETLANYALMVLMQIPGKSVNEALRRELPNAPARAQIEIMDTLGERRDSEAVPLLAPQLASNDATISEAAASALGKIGDARALQVLREAYTPASGARRLALGRALLEGAERLPNADKASALVIYELLDRNAATPELGAGALRGIVQAGSPQALPRLLDALGKDDSPMQMIAANLLREITGKDVTARLSERLPQMTPQAQLLSIAALGERGDAASVPALMPLARNANSAVRLAALNALGTVGDVTTVPLLLQMAAETSGAPRAAARAGLARLRGRTIDEKLLGLWKSAKPAERVEIITALGARRVEAAIPRLIEEARGKDALSGAAAALVLRDMGRAQDLPALLAFLPTAQNNRAALTTAITEIARRGVGEDQRTGPILQRLRAVSAPAERAELLFVLGKVGGPEALKALQAALGDKVPEVRLAALRHLAEWPTDEPMNDLLRVVRTTPDEKQRAIALRGYLPMIALSGQRSPQESAGLYRETLPLLKSVADKRLLLSGLAKIPSLPSLEFASGFLKDNEVRTEAEVAVAEIGRGTAGAWRDQTRALLEPIARNSADNNARARSAETLALINKFGDFAMAWEASPAYQQKGAGCQQLFDIAFAPEIAAQSHSVPWRLMPVGTMPEQPWLLDLLGLWGGEQRVAYLRSAVWAEAAREVVLEVGSDDGAKIWCNGQIVLSNNTQRAVVPGQDKVKLPLKAGWNQLLLKVTQNNMGWGACARFANPDGSAATGLRSLVPSGIEAASKG